jgi:mono/diheme cytochrome c family protein
MEDGSGLQGVIPPLAKSDYLEPNRDRLACIIRYGIEEPMVVNGVKYNQPMAGIDRLSDFEIANIINYVNNAWGNENPYMSIEEVRKSLNVCQPTE